MSRNRIPLAAPVHIVHVWDAVLDGVPLYEDCRDCAAPTIHRLTMQAEGHPAYVVVICEGCVR